MVYCPHCAAENPDGAKFCNNCAKEIISISLTKTGSRNCVSCGRSIDWMAIICPYCGHDYRERKKEYPQE